MPITYKPARLLLTTLLAASTTLTGPTFALAVQPGAVRLAQADDQGAEPGEAPVKPRRQNRQAQPEAGEAAGAEGGQTRQQQRRNVQPQAGEAGEAESSEQPARKQRGNAQNTAQPSASEAGAAAAPDAEQPTPRRQRRQAQEPATSGSETPAQPGAASAGSADESEQASSPSRRNQPQPAASDLDSAGSPTSETGAAAPRRDRKNRRQQSESAPAPADEPAAAGSAADETSQTPAARRQRNAQPSTSETPATAAQPETQPTEGQNGANRRQRQREQAGDATATTPPAAATQTEPGNAAPATPDASAPATGTAAAPSGEVPANPRRQRTAPVAPNAASRAGAPDATPAVPGATDAPAASGTGEATGTAPAPSGTATTGQPRPLAPERGRQPAPGQAPGQAQVPPVGTSGAPAAAGLNPQPVPTEVQNAPVQPGRIDQSDARVQTLQQPVAVQPITQERGQRVQDAPRYELPPDAKVVKRDGDRQILNLGAAAVAGAVAGAAAGYFIRSNDDDRLGQDSRDRYTERLPRGRTRETIVRDNGVQVVTITNRYGDVVQRSRVLPDGREVVLFYDPDSADDRRPDYYDDPGRDLPPVRVDIPEDEYVVDTDQPDEDLYYDTLVAPPVETVERIYSIDEVRRSPRIRDKVRRIDLATINFDFASATVPQDQVNKLQALADAIDKVVKANPGETFLIEGHTDAVGSPEANLVLSDKRAESVASALTQYFDVPAENLVTQGYGEQELKVDTQSENRENRRVTVRRITALVKPVETSGR